MRRGRSGAVRAGTLALVGCLLALTACSGPKAPTTSDTQVSVDTAALREFKAKAGIATCVPGPGGGSLPDLTLPCLGGGPSVDLASLRGPMLVNVWGSWCGPCRKELPVLGAFDKAYGTKVAVLGVDYEDQFPAMALQQLEADGLTYPQVVDQSGALADQKKLRLNGGVPQTFFIAANGSLSWVQGRALTSTAEIKSLVKQHLGVTL